MQRAQDAEEDEIRKITKYAIGCGGLLITIGTVFTGTVLYLIYLVIQKM